MFFLLLFIAKMNFYENRASATTPRHLRDNSATSPRQLRDNFGPENNISAKKSEYTNNFIFLIFLKKNKINIYFFSYILKCYHIFIINSILKCPLSYNTNITQKHVLIHSASPTKILKTFP